MQFRPVFQYLTGNQYVSGCEQCGRNDFPPKCYEINGSTHYICESCKSNIHATLQQQKERTMSQKSALLPGIVGAFLGSLIGCVLWVLIFKLGYIAGIAGAVTAICAMKGYEMLGKCLDRKGVILSVLFSFLSIYLANKLAWSWDAYSALSEYDWSFFECFQQLGYILEQSQLTDTYIGDLVVGYLLTIICSIRPIIQAFKSSRGDYSIK